MVVFGFRQSYLYSLAGAIIFSLFILYDTSLLMNKLVRVFFLISSVHVFICYIVHNTPLSLPIRSAVLTNGVWVVYGFFSDCV